MSKVSLNPKTYEADQTKYDLKEALSPRVLEKRNSDEKQHWLTICRLPTDLTLCADKIRKRIRGKPSRNILFMVSTNFGLSIITSQDPVKKLIKIKDRFDKEDFESWAAESICGEFFSNFPIDITISGTSRRHSYPIDKPIYGFLSGVAGELGVSKSELATLCIMTCFVVQDSLNDTFKSKCDDILSDWLTKIDLKVRMSTALIDVARASKTSVIRRV